MIDKNTELKDIEIFKPNYPAIMERFIKKGYNTVGSVIDLGFFGYLSEDFCMAEIFQINNLLGKLGYSIIGEEYAMAYEDYEDNELISISDNIDRLSALRNSIRGKEGFLAEEIVLTQKIMDSLEQLKDVKKTKNSITK